MPLKASNGHTYPVPTKEARLLVKDVTERLQESADPDTKKFTEQYLKTVESRGNKVPAIKAAVTATFNAAPSALPSDVYAAAFLLFISKFTDDKYAGLMFLSQRLILNSAIFEPPNRVLQDRLLDDVSALFDSGVVDNWSACDGLSGHVIGPFVARHPRRRAVADLVLAWSHLDPSSSTVWKRRAGHVSFVTLVHNRTAAPAAHKRKAPPPDLPAASDAPLPPYARGGGGDALFGAGFLSALIAACRAALACPHRFAQTGGGWVLRECLVARPAEAAAALRAAGPGMSREGMRYALEKCPDPRLREELMALPGAGPGAGGGGGGDGGGGAGDVERESGAEAEGDVPDKTARAAKKAKAGKARSDQGIIGEAAAARIAKTGKGSDQAGAGEAGAAGTAAGAARRGRRRRGAE
jgi:3-methyladenine DNA glycosylase AlkD